MSKDSVEKVLKNFGLTPSEIKVYIFLAKHGVLKCSEVARQMRKDRAQTLRILKSLQTKNLVEATLEAPTRFASVPFEQVIDLSIKAKRDEVALIERTKRELLDYWKKIGKSVLEPSPEKFVVIEGSGKIYPKIAQIIEETKNQLSSISTVADLVRSIQPSLFEAVLRYHLKSNIQFRFLTEVPDQNIKTVKSLLKRLKTKVEIEVRNPDLGLRLFPRMMIRDNEEILLFIQPKATGAEDQASLCLWTNCGTIVQSFSVVFEDLWINSTGLSEKIAEIETGKLTQTANLISGISPTLKTYNEALMSAKEEIMILTSPEGLLDFWKRIALLRELSGKGVSVKIMTPITRENWKVAQELSQYCSIKHTTASYLESTIVDGKYLIQSQNRAGQGGKEERILYFGTFYTDDRDCVEKTKNMLNDVWRNALIPSVSTLDTLIKTMPAAAPSSESRQQSPKSGDLHRKLALEGKEKKEVLLEKDVLNKIISGKKYPAKNWPNDIIRFYGSNGIATIHPPASFNLPDMAIWAMHNDKLSSFGVADCLFVHLWLETPKGGAYVPVAFVSDNPEVIEFHKKIATGVPSGQNAHLIRKDALQIRVLGNTLFVGWTTPIPLFPTLQSLPPSCIMFEGYNPLKTGANELGYPSGIKIINEFNGFDAFVTFFHPASKYSGPGTDGIVLRDVITTVYPP